MYKVGDLFIVSQLRLLSRSLWIWHQELLLSSVVVAVVWVCKDGIPISSFIATERFCLGQCFLATRERGSVDLGVDYGQLVWPWLQR